jgi:alpha-N-acetylglucosaminidase
VNIALTPAQGCVFSWSIDASAGFASYTASTAVPNAAWVKLSRIGNTYVGACSADGVSWTIAGSAVPGGVGVTADIGMFASAVNAGASDRLRAVFDQWRMSDTGPSGDAAVAIEYFHARLAITS